MVGILAFIAVLVVVAVIVVFTRGAPQPLDEGTPERAVQEYAAAVIDGDHQAAQELLSPTWTEDCGRMDYGATATNLRITLVSTDIHGDTATVAVLVGTGAGNGPFGGSGYEYEDAFQLEQHGDRWLIAAMPWDLSICPPSDVS